MGTISNANLDLSVLVDNVFLLPTLHNYSLRKFTLSKVNPVTSTICSSVKVPRDSRLRADISAASFKPSSLPFFKPFFKPVCCIEQGLTVRLLHYSESQ